MWTPSKSNLSLYFLIFVFFSISYRILELCNSLCAHCAPFNCSGSRFLSLVSYYFICFYLSLSFVFPPRHYDYIAPHCLFEIDESFLLYINLRFTRKLFRVWFGWSIVSRVSFCLCVVRKWNRHSGLVGEEKGVVASFFFSRSGWCNEELGELDTCVRETRTHSPQPPRKKSCVRRPLFFFRIFPTYVFRVFGATVEGKTKCRSQTNQRIGTLV